MKRYMKVIAGLLALFAVLLVLMLLDGSREARNSAATSCEISTVKTERVAEGALSHRAESGAGTDAVKMAASCAVGVGQVVVFSAAVLIALNGQKRF